MPFGNDNDEDSTFDEVAAMADRLGIKGKQRAAYIEDHMVQLGYEPVQTRDSYARVQQEEGGESGPNRWGFGGGGGGGNRRGSGGGRRDQEDNF